MDNLFFDDKAYIAEQFCLEDDYTAQSARFASHKINSFKLSLSKEAYCMNKADLSQILKGTLLNYTQPCIVLSSLGFFEEEKNN